MALTWGNIEEAAMTFKRADENKTQTFKKISTSNSSQNYMQPENAVITINSLAAIAGISFVADENARLTTINVPTETE